MNIFISEPLLLYIGLILFLFGALCYLIGSFNAEVSSEMRHSKSIIARGAAEIGRAMP